MLFFILLGVTFYMLSWFKIVSLTYAMYFLVGFVLSQSQIDIRKACPASWWAIVPIVLLYLAPHLDNPFTTLGCSTIRGAMIVYFMVCFLSAIYQSVSTTKGVQACLYIGRNTLPILLFSPIFTFACKWLVAPLAWDKTGFIFMVLSTAITVGGSLGIDWVMDRLHLSRWFSGKNLLSA